MQSTSSTRFQFRIWHLFLFEFLVSFLVAGLLSYFEFIPLRTALVWVIPIFLGVAALSFVVYGSLLWRKMEQKVLKEGSSAKAMILEARKSYDSEDSAFQIELKLNVFLEGELPFQTTVLLSKEQSQVGSYHQGNLIPVKVGLIRSNETNQVLQHIVTLDPLWGNERALTVWANQEEFETWLWRHNSESEDIYRTGELAQAKVLSFQSLGMFLEGNPVVEIAVEVTPESMPAFTGSFRAIIQANSFMKFQPGNTVWVKFDKQNPKQVVLVGSTPKETTMILHTEVRVHRQS